MTTKLPAYFEDYLEEKFKRVNDQTKDILGIIREVKAQSKANHICATEVKVLLQTNMITTKGLEKKVHRLFMLGGLIVAFLIGHVFLIPGHSEGSVTLIQALFSVLARGL